MGFGLSVGLTEVDDAGLAVGVAVASVVAVTQGVGVGWPVGTTSGGREGPDDFGSTPPTWDRTRMPISPPAHTRA